jgi:signal transduction histidine kinase
MNKLGRELTERALKTGERQEPYLLEIKHADGDTRIIEINESPVKNEQGVVTGIAGAVRDITRAYNAEKEKEHLQSQLLQSQKMEAIGRLAGGIAHDFNNLMTVVSGYCDIIRGKLQDNPDALADVDEIARAGQRATQLTRQLLAFSRKQVLELETFNLKDVVEGTENMLKRLIGEDIELRYSSPACSPFICADRGQIQQILVNLAVNARDAMPAGGKLTIETRCVDLDYDFANSHLESVPGSYVLLAVSDTGTGMSEEVMSKIFEPFFTTKEKGKGTGLGLSTVYGIVRQIGGTVKAYSEPGIGTSFKIYLPRADSNESGDILPVFNPEQERGDETILLTEDDKEVRGVIYAILQTSGYNILEASNGQNALDICRNNEIDLLLTDIVMPGMGGIEPAERLREKTPSLRVLFMSGYTDDAIQNSRTLLPGTWFIEKPFTMASLLNKIRTVLCS